MMEAILEHPEKTLTEIVQETMRVFGNRFHLSTICRYFQRNGVTRKTVRFTVILLYNLPYNFRRFYTCFRSEPA